MNEPGAKDTAASFWREVTYAGRDILRVLVNGALEDETWRFTPQELVAATGARSTQSVAGTLGGVGEVVSAHNLTFYECSTGTRWHFVWDWDSKQRVYWMSVGMAELLRSVGAWNTHRSTTPARRTTSREFRAHRETVNPDHLPLRGIIGRTMTFTNPGLRGAKASSDRTIVEQLRRHRFLQVTEFGFG